MHKKGFCLMVMALLPLAIAVPAHANDHTISGAGFVGCQSVEDLDRLERFLVDKDLVAYRKGVAAGVASGQCARFRDGEKVVSEGTKMWNGVVKLRRAGEVSGYWTPMEAIK